MRKDINCQITLTPEASETVFYEALCNGLGYFEHYGIRLQHSDFEYNQSKMKLENPCYEDVLMQMLRDGYKLYFNDVENDDRYYDRTITLKDIHEKVSKIPFRNLSNILEENSDAEDADAVIQTVLYDEVIFG